MILTVTLWIVQIALAGLFGFAGFIKTFRPIPELAKVVTWAADVPVALTRFIGVAELAAAVGVILPVLTGILPWLTPLAALGLAVIQVLAIGFHAVRKEPVALPFNLALLAASAFVAWGTWGYFTTAPVTGVA